MKKNKKRQGKNALQVLLVLFFLQVLLMFHLLLHFVPSRTFYTLTDSLALHFFLRRRVYDLDPEQNTETWTWTSSLANKWMKAIKGTPASSSFKESMTEVKGVLSFTSGTLVTATSSSLEAIFPREVKAVMPWCTEVPGFDFHHMCVRIIYI